MYTCELRHIYKDLQSVSTCKGANICDFAQHVFTYKTIHDTIYIYIYIETNTCEYMYVYKEVLSVSARKGTNMCDIAQQGLIYKRICDMIYVYLWANVCIQRSSKCEHSQGKRHTWVAQHGFIYKSIDSYTRVSLIRSAYTCEYSST